MWELGTYYNYVIQMNVCHALYYNRGFRDDLMTILENDNGTQMSKLIYSYSSCELVIRETDGLHTPALVRDFKIVAMVFGKLERMGF